MMRFKSCLFAVLAVGLMTCTSSAGVTWTTGAPGGSSPGGGLDFTGGGGRSSFVDVVGLNINALGQGGGSYTIQAWISPDDGNDRWFLGSTDQGIHHGIRSGGKLRFAHWGADFSANTVLPTGPASDPNSWSHAVFTYDGAVASMYLNGVLDGQMAEAPPNKSGGNFIFGARNNGNNGLNGQMDEIAVWNSVLSQADITALAGGAAANTIGSPLGFWNLEEGAGLTAADSSGNGIDGALPLPPPPPPMWDFSGAQDLQGWTVLNGAPSFTAGDGGGVGPANADGNRAHDGAHVTFLMESPEFSMDGTLQSGDRAMFWLTAGGAGDQEGNGPDYANPGEVLAFNGGNSASNGEKGLAFLNSATGQYDAVLFNNGNGGTDTNQLTRADLEAAGVDFSQIYKLQYYETDEGGWGWGQLNGVEVAMGPVVPEPSTLVLAGLALLGLAGHGLRRRRRA